MDGIVTIADFGDTVDIMYGIGDEVYKRYEGDKPALRELMCEVLDRIHDLDHTKGGLEFKHRDSAKQKYNEFLKKYNTKDLWEGDDIYTLDIL
jgi:hypothetical protein